MGYSLLAGAIVLAVMTIPYILNMLIEVFRAIPLELKEASLALGATHWQTIKRVVVRKGMTGISALWLGYFQSLGRNHCRANGDWKCGANAQKCV